MKMVICTKAQARAAIKLCRDKLNIGSPFVNQYTQYRTLKWYVPPSDRDSRIDKSLRRAGIPYRRRVNSRWPRKTPRQVRGAYTQYGQVPTMRMASSLIISVPSDFRVRDVKPPRRSKRKVYKPRKIRCPCCNSWISPRRELHYVD